MLKELPGWIVDNRTSVLEEVKAWRGLSAVECWHLAELCAQDAIWAVRASGLAEQILQYRDPLPESSVAALQRLRNDAGWGNG